MRLSVVERPIERVGIHHERSFSIKATGKAFRILSSGLYKDKIRAIIRELACNAQDAHVAAGKRHVPFAVHLPNALEPFFAVRDEGVGLSDEDMNLTYTTYFESTKTDSNDVIGALGLGSKSPFSYVDSFTVVACHAGVKRTYTAFIAEDGMPALVRLGEEPSDAPNGLEVIIPVEKTGDFAEFARKAADALAHFDPPPLVTGRSDFAFATHPVVLRGDGWRVVDRPSRGVHAVMGAVAYPLDPHAVPGLTPRASNLLQQASLDIDFPIGALDITAGREELSYDPTLTIPAIQARAQAIAEELPARVATLFEGCASEFAARRLYRTLLGHGTPLGRALGTASVAWRGRTIASDSFTVEPSDLAGLVVVTFVHNAGRGGISRGTLAPEQTLHVRAADHVRLIRDDLARGAPSRVRHLIRQDRNLMVVLIAGEDPDVDRLMGLLDGMTIAPASGLAKPPPSPRGKAQVKMLGLAGKKNAKVGVDQLQPTEVEMDDGGLYVVTKNQKIVGVDDRAAFQNLLATAVENGLFDPDKDDLFFVPTTLAAPFAKHEDWQAFVPAMRAKAEAKLRAESASTTFATARAWRALQARDHDPTPFEPMLTRLAALLPEGHALAGMLAAWREGRKAYQSQQRLQRLAELFAIEVTDAPAVRDLDAEWRDFIGKYPMLGSVLHHDRWHCFQHDITTYAGYITLIDHQGNI